MRVLIHGLCVGSVEPDFRGKWFIFETTIYLIETEAYSKILDGPFEEESQAKARMKEIAE